MSLLLRFLAALLPATRLRGRGTDSVAMRDWPLWCWSEA